MQQYKVSLPGLPQHRVEASSVDGAFGAYKELLGVVRTKARPKIVPVVESTVQAVEIAEPARDSGVGSPGPAPESIRLTELSEPTAAATHPPLSPSRPVVRKRP